ncbi:MAG: cyclodeaminase/cyclohydrolase family protein [Thermodesulfobacteriota bacterium]
MPTLGQFLDSVADSTPTPGGGSVSALAGALSAALVEMVAGLTLGKKGYEFCRDEMMEIKTRADSYRQTLENAIAEDSGAYQMVLDAYRLPRGNEEEKKARTEQIQRRLMKAAEPPLLTAETSLKVMELCLAAVKKGNPSAVTDAAVGALLAHAALQGGILNVMVNLSSVKQADYVEQLKERLIFLQADGDRIRNEIMALVKERMGIQS